MPRPAAIRCHCPAFSILLGQPPPTLRMIHSPPRQPLSPRKSASGRDGRHSRSGYSTSVVDIPASESRWRFLWITWRFSGKAGGAARIEDRGQRFAGVAPAEPQTPPAEQESEQGRFDQSLEIEHQVELAAPAAHEARQVAEPGRHAPSGFQVEGHDLVDAREIVEQRRSGRSAIQVMRAAGKRRRSAWKAGRVCTMSPREDRRMMAMFFNLAVQFLDLLDQQRSGADLVAADDGHPAAVAAGRCHAPEWSPGCSPSPCNGNGG